MKTMNIGKLNKRITFLKLAEVEDEIGQLTQELQPIKQVWASFYPVRGYEFMEAQKIQSKISHKCYVRYLEGIDANCMIEYAGKQYKIDSVIDVGMERKMLEIYCYEYVNSEEIEHGRPDDIYGD